MCIKNRTSSNRTLNLALLAAAVGAFHLLLLLAVALMLLGQYAVHIGLESLTALRAQGVHPLPAVVAADPGRHLSLQGPTA